MGYEEYKRKALEPIVNYIESVLASYSKEELEARIKEALPKKESEDERIRKKCIELIKRVIPSGNNQSSESKDILDCIAYLEKQKEQQELPLIDGDTDLYFDEWKQRFKGNPTKRQCFEEGIRYSERKQEEQKPAEWSEDFEDNIRNLLHDKLSGHSEDGSMSWATSIDDKTLKDIVSGIWFYVGKEALKYPSKELNVTKWSEEDENIINGAISALEVYGHKKLAKRLKSLHPQPHWKPSKEQIDALNSIILNGSFTYVGQVQDLISLKDDLKKLM